MNLNQMISRKRVLAGAGLALAAFLFSGTWALAGNVGAGSTRAATTTPGVVSTIPPEPPPIFRSPAPTPTPVATPTPAAAPAGTGAVEAATATAHGAVLADTGTPMFYLVLGVILLLVGVWIYRARRRIA
jgi:hypothetical protein